MGCVIGRNKVEEAYPFFDNDFVDWLQRIPPALRLNYGIYRLFLKELSPELAGVTRQLTGVPASAPPLLAKMGIYYQQGKINLKRLVNRLSGGRIYLGNTFGYQSLHDCFLVNENWRRAVADMLTDKSPLLGEYLNMDYVRRLLEEHGRLLSPSQVLRQKRVTTDRSLPLSFVLTFALFLRLFFKQADVV